MPKQTSRQAWVDRYIRDELTVDEMAEFEASLMESPGMQQELETVLGLREALRCESKQEIGTVDLLPNSLSRVGKWQSPALAATVILAVFSTVMFWKVSNDSADLQRELNLLSQPRTQILSVPVNITRSVGRQTPVVIVQKPAGHSAILLDIELGSRARELDMLAFALIDDAGNYILTWTAAPAADGRASVMLNNEQVPASRLWLQISSGDGQVLERSLLEFR